MRRSLGVCDPPNSSAWWGHRHLCHTTMTATLPVAVPQLPVVCLVSALALTPATFLGTCRTTPTQDHTLLQTRITHLGFLSPGHPSWE